MISYIIDLAGADPFGFDFFLLLPANPDVLSKKETTGLECEKLSRNNRDGEKVP